jgi:hypothetical protein
VRISISRSERYVALLAPSRCSSSDVDGEVMLAPSFLLLDSLPVPPVILFEGSLARLAHSLTRETESRE